jgi:hypothetical protein
MFFNRITTTSETFFGGRFNFGAAFPLSQIITTNAGATTLTAVSNTLSANRPDLLPALATPITSLQAFNLGLPTVYQQGFGDASANSWTNRYGLYVQDSWKLRPNFMLNYGLRYAIHDEPFFIPTYKKDFQPRVGFSWDPFGNGKTAIRAGAGIFVGFLNNAVANVTTELSGMGDPDNINIVLTTATSNALGLPRSIDVYQRLLMNNVLGTRAITLADVAPLSINPRPGAPLEVRFRLGPNYRNPTTYQTSLGVQRDVGAGVSAELNYLFARGIHITRNRDINQFRQTGTGINAATGKPCFVRFPGAPSPTNSCPGAASDFIVATRFQDNVYETTANSFYHAFTAQAQRRFSRNFSLNAHYTFSKSIDEVTDFNSDFSAQNPLNLQMDRALSSFDQRHRFVASGVIQSPFQNPVVRDWLVSPIVVAQSGRPFNLLLGFDANNDGRSQSDRPGQAGRNTGRGESFYSFDMRLARRFFAKESRYLEITVEGFNLFNRTNFQGINNVVGLTPLTDFDARGRSDRGPTSPLGFTSASDPRQLQFGARLNF